MKYCADWGGMYVCDERMKRNIDKAGGDGTAAFVSEAIAAYVTGRSGMQHKT